MGLLRRNKKNQKPSAEESLPPLELKLKAFKDSSQAQGVLIACRQLPGFAPLMELLAQVILGRGERLMLSYARAGVAVQARVDGVWEKLPPMERAGGDALLVVLKKLCGLDPAERRAKQVGRLEIGFSHQELVCEVVSQGTQTGERVMLSLDPKKEPLLSLDDLGMRPKQIEQVKSHLNASGGLVIVGAPPGHGLPTLWRLTVGAADRFTRDFVSIEDRARPEPEIINVSPTFFDLRDNLSAEDHFARLLLRQPDAFVLPDLHSEAFTEKLIEQLHHDKHAILRVPGSDAVEVLLKTLSRYPKLAKELLKVTRAVISGRLLRRLCEDCRQPFVPTPAQLQKLGLPSDRINKLYRPTIAPPPDQRIDDKGQEIEVCKSCQGRGYRGRMGIYELLEVSDELRRELLRRPQPDAVRKAAATLGHASLSQQGLVAVSRGDTSWPELQRVLTAAPRR